MYNAAYHVGESIVFASNPILCTDRLIAKFFLCYKSKNFGLQHLPSQLANPHIFNTLVCNKIHPSQIPTKFLTQSSNKMLRMKKTQPTQQTAPYVNDINLCAHHFRDGLRPVSQVLLPPRPSSHRAPGVVRQARPLPMLPPLVHSTAVPHPLSIPHRQISKNITFPYSRAGFRDASTGM